MEVDVSLSASSSFLVSVLTHMSSLFQGKLFHAALFRIILFWIDLFGAMWTKAPAWISNLIN